MDLRYSQMMLLLVQLYPDMGVAAMLKNEWQDATFSIGAMSDRTPYQDEDEIVVFAAPDPQGDQMCPTPFHSYLLQLA